MIYKPIPPEEQSGRSEKLDPRPYLRILQGIDQRYPEEERGDLLLFLSGMSEISTIQEACQVYATHTRRWIVLPLHSTLSLVQQDKARPPSPPVKPDRLTVGQLSDVSFSSRCLTSLLQVSESASSPPTSPRPQSQ